MRDHAKPVIQKEHHLRVPVVRRQRPAMRKDNGLPAAPIFVENLNAILRTHLTHRMLSLMLFNGRPAVSLWAPGGMGSNCRKEEHARAADYEVSARLGYHGSLFWDLAVCTIQPPQRRM